MKPTLWQRLYQALRGGRSKCAADGCQNERAELEAECEGHSKLNEALAARDALSCALDAQTKRLQSLRAEYDALDDVAAKLNEDLAECRKTLEWAGVSTGDLGGKDKSA